MSQLKAFRVKLVQFSFIFLTQWILPQALASDIRGVVSLDSDSFNDEKSGWENLSESDLASEIFLLDEEIEQANAQEDDSDQNGNQLADIDVDSGYFSSTSYAGPFLVPARAPSAMGFNEGFNGDDPDGSIKAWQYWLDSRNDSDDAPYRYEDEIKGLCKKSNLPLMVQYPRFGEFCLRTVKDLELSSSEKDRILMPPLD